VDPNVVGVIRKLLEDEGQLLGGPAMVIIEGVEIIKFIGVLAIPAVIALIKPDVKLNGTGTWIELSFRTVKPETNVSVLNTKASTLVRFEPSKVMLSPAQTAVLLRPPLLTSVSDGVAEKAYFHSPEIDPK